MGNWLIQALTIETLPTSYREPKHYSTASKDDILVGALRASHVCMPWQHVTAETVRILSLTSWLHTELQSTPPCAFYLNPHMPTSA
eukprot:1568409-Amphidinium_carterae.3